MSVIVKNVRGQRAKAQAGVEASISFFFSDLGLHDHLLCERKYIF